MQWNRKDQDRIEMAQDEQKKIGWKKAIEQKNDK